jgi:kumamolisin
MASGGGVSTHIARPAWQASHDVPVAPGGFVGRGIPDVAAVADPASSIDLVVGGERGPASGTSAAAPLWAALVARLNEAAGRPVGHLNPALYEAARRGRPVTHDVVRGSNGAYDARRGWDACTGLGVPNGREILRAIAEA